jgi:hypothetical protein
MEDMLNAKRLAVECDASELSERRYTVGDDKQNDVEAHLGTEIGGTEIGGTEIGATDVEPDVEGHRLANELAGTEIGGTEIGASEIGATEL